MPLRYHVGPAEALGLEITPTQKVGGRKMAAERCGVRTPEGDHNAAAIWEDRLAAIDRALDNAIAALLDEIERERRSVFRGFERFQVARVWFDQRPNDWALLSSAFCEEAVQQRLGRIYGEQCREIARVVGRIETLQKIAAADDGLLAADAICGMEELVGAWRFTSEVKEAVKKRQAAIARERDEQTRAEIMPSAAAVRRETSPDISLVNKDECVSTRVAPLMNDPGPSLKTVPSISMDHVASVGRTTDAKPTITRGEPDTPNQVGGDGAMQRSDEARDSGPQPIISSVPALGAARRKLENRILAGGDRKSIPPSPAAEIARDVARARRAAASAGAESEQDRQ